MPFDPFESDLPVAEVLPRLIDELAARHAVLVAEPGAGKTTLVPPALLAAGWLRGRIILLEPRRVVARAAASRIAALMGGSLGGVVGTRMRMDVRVSAGTRIEVVTEGVFTRMALDDPELSNVGAVIFDEYHERSLDADFGLALALDIARSLRPDLRLLVMSATLDADAVAALMDGAAVVRSRGRTYPVAIDYRPVAPNVPLERAVADAVRRDVRSTLAFLPGRAEVERTVSHLETLVDATVLPLHGGLEPAAQDRAVRPLDGGGPKVVIATPIAESSLTIEGIERVIDSGLVREPVHDVATGITMLETRRASLASIEQRAGRAGRTGPGEAVRLWPEAATRALPEHAPPEIVRSDLTQLLLDCLDWGTDPANLSWLDVPPPAALSAARERLRAIGAISWEADTITPFGRALGRLPLPPRVAAAVLSSSQGAERQLAARYALLLAERGLGGHMTDLTVREKRWRRDRGHRAKSAATLASRWGAAGASANGAWDAASAFAMAHADRLARARGASRPDGRRAYLLASGRGAFLAADDPLAAEEWLVALDLTGRAREQRIVAALPISRANIEEAFADAIEDHAVLQVHDQRTEALVERRIGAIVVGRRTVPIQTLSQDVRSKAFAAAVRARGIADLPWSGEAERLRVRIAWAGVRDPERWPDISDEALAARVEEWLLPHLPDASALSAITPTVLRDALHSMLAWDGVDALSSVAPERFVAPTGTRAVIDYPSDGSSPRISIRVQELFGVDAHPMAASEPLLLDLLSPAQRTIQTTSDLPGFWRGSWSDVRSDMRARYPRHPWPERPWEAEATTRANPRR